MLSDIHCIRRPTATHYDETVNDYVYNELFTLDAYDRRNFEGGYIYE